MSAGHYRLDTWTKLERKRTSIGYTLFCPNRNQYPLQNARRLAKEASELAELAAILVEESKKNGSIQQHKQD